MIFLHMIYISNTINQVFGNEAKNCFTLLINVEIVLKDQNLQRNVG